MIIRITISCIIVLFLVFLYFFMISPNMITEERRKKMQPFIDHLIAHRGYFNPALGIPENSLKAFARAVKAGYGIELDVQMTTDEQLVVFHDATLKRMCGEKKKLVDCSYEELQAFRLKDSEEKIPLLKEVLDVISGQVPIVVEIKYDGDWKRTTELTLQMLGNYQGIYCIESFSPFIIAMVKKYRPEIIRGQLSTNFLRGDSDLCRFQKNILTHMLLNFMSKPDFIAFNHKHVDAFGYRAVRKLYPVFNVAWTIRSQEELKKAGEVFDVFIFDSFTPE